jgi:uncharacterized Tic20 family protein
METGTPSDTGGTPPPGWYPDPNGQLRWWDGQQWGEVQAQAPQTQPGVGAPAAGGTDPKTLAMLAQLLGLVGFLGPLIIYLVSGDKDPFVKHHAAESLNFQLTVLIGYVISAILMIVLIGFLTFLVIWVAAIALTIIAAMAANRGEWYRYPISIRMVPGAVG